MSAAPAPPPHLYSLNPTQHESKQSNTKWSDRGDGREGGRNGVASLHKSIPHIRDLVYEAESRADIYQPASAYFQHFLLDTNFVTGEAVVGSRR